MGGQACVLYGGAEFSRDLDLCVLAESGNLSRLIVALAELRADNIAVPQLEQSLLERGHAVHYRCRVPEAAGLRIDLMSSMRGVDSFEDLWRRRTTIQLDDGEHEEIDVLALPDLIRAKKTQRDKDWPMIRRLVEVAWFRPGADETPERAAFLLSELRTPELLVDACARYPEAATKNHPRPAVQSAIAGDLENVRRLLQAEEALERSADATYWAGLKTELEQFRRARRDASKQDETPRA